MIGFRPPEQITLGPVSLYTYAVCILAGTTVAYFLSRGAATRAGLTHDQLQVSLLYGLVPGVIGARLYHVIDQAGYYLDQPAQMFALWNGGLGILGGLAGGALGLAVFAHQYRVPLLKLCDIWAPGVLAAQAIGRLGNWANQEAFGPPSSLAWAIPIEPDHRPPEYALAATFHPTFLYELGWDALGLAVILLLRPHWELTPGRTLGAYLVAYGSGRIMAESFRFGTATLSGFKVAYLIAGALVIGGIYLLLRKPSEVRPSRRSDRRRPTQR